ncbi:hypothetical protein SSCI18S_03797 [Sphingobium scionense]
MRDRAINLSVAGDIHAQLSKRYARRGLMISTSLLVGIHQGFHDFADMPLIDGARVMQPGNDGSQRKLGGVVHPESPFALTIARRAS